MSRCKLLRVTIERFKSFEAETTIKFNPLTVVVGRNNCGKSTIIQALLLMKQTLAEPRRDVPVHLDGPVAAFNLRELTWGWPAPSDEVNGPSFGLRWACDVDVEAALAEAKQPDIDNLVKWTGLDDLRAWVSGTNRARMTSEIRISSSERAGTIALSEITLWAPKIDPDEPMIRLSNPDGQWRCFWRGERATQIQVQLDHFLPYLQIDRRNVGPRHRQRSWHNAYLILFAQPLEALKTLISELQYLASTRSVPPSLYKTSNVAPQEIGASGELDAQLLHRRQHDLVHYLPPLEVSDDRASLPDTVREGQLVDAVNEVLAALSVHDRLSIEEIKEVGFRILFGNSGLPHVGRGLTYLLPLVELGLLSDPVLGFGPAGDLGRRDYRELCDSFAHVATEEPEAHLHPKVQSRLAHFLVSLAMSNRRLIVETHSDHLVRRLRGIAARADRGSDLERWLVKNVAIVEVEQDERGRSTARTSYLTAEGDIRERWPADFMDEASDEDGAIYYARLEKTAPETRGDQVEFVEGAEPEADEEP